MYTLDELCCGECGNIHAGGEEGVCVWGGGGGEEGVGGVGGGGTLLD